MFIRVSARDFSLYQIRNKIHIYFLNIHYYILFVHDHIYYIFHIYDQQWYVKLDIYIVELYNYSL